MFTRKLLFCVLKKLWDSQSKLNSEGILRCTDNFYFILINVFV